MAARTQVAKAQAKFGKGLSATLTRAKDRIETPLTLHHNYDASRVPAILQKIQSLLPLGMSLVQGTVTDDSTALAASEAHNERLLAEKRALQAQVAALQQQIDAQLNAVPAEGARWMTLPDAAEIIGTSYSTLHRAQADGRLVTRKIGGKKKKQMMCDPSTYISLTAGKLASKGT